MKYSLNMIYFFYLVLNAAILLSVSFTPIRELNDNLPDPHIQSEFRNYVDTILNVNTFGINLTSDIYSRSVLSHGDKAMISNMLALLSQKRCLKIVAIGGSICAGKETPKLSQTAFPYFLVDHLNRYLPCKDEHGALSYHQQFNKCRDAYQTTGFIDIFQEIIGEINGNMNLSIGSSSFIKCVEDADVFLIDTSVNDSPVPPNMNALDHFQLNVQKNMEILIRQIKNLPKFPTIIYTGTSSSYELLWTDRMNYPRLGDSAYFQAEVARYFGIPYISVIDALGPFDTPDKINFIKNSYLCSFCRGKHHPQEHGHQLLAALIMDYILTSHLGNRGVEKYNFDSVPDNRLPPLKFASEQQMHNALSPISYRLDLETAKPVSFNGNWTWMADVARKFGLISFNVNDWITFDMNLSGFPHTATHGVVHVLMLKSYTNIGVVEIKIQVGEELLISKVIDCRWEMKVSQVSVETFQFPLKPETTHYNLTFYNSLDSSYRIRPVNKVKILHVIAFSNEWQ